MTDRPIIFSAEMVKAILEGRKTQTRRVIKKVSDEQWVAPIQLECEPTLWTWRSTKTGEVEVARCPYGQQGDRLWVRETFSYCERDPRGVVNQPVWYWADGNPPGGDWTKPKPSIHMPKKYARIWREITGVRVQRVQEISNYDAWCEGTECGYYCDPCGEHPYIGEDDCHPYAGHHDHYGSFKTLWDSLNAKRGYGWDVNPFVWVIEFRRQDEKGEES